MPIDPWRGRLWAAAPLPPLCSALTAYRSDAPGMRELIVEAAGRLINGSERHLHPDVNPSDQTALWFAYVLTAPRTRLRVLALPEESRYVENSRPEASAHWSSSTPRHPQSKLRAASSLGQPRPIGRYVPAGRPHRPCSPHSNGPLLDFIERRAARLTRRRPLRPCRPCRPCWCARLRAGAPLGSLPVRGLSQLLALHHGQLRLSLRRPLLRLARARVSGG